MANTHITKMKVLLIGAFTLISTSSIADVTTTQTCSPPDGYGLKLLNRYIEIFNDEIGRRKTYKGFSCAGIGMIDHHSAMDGELLYFNTPKRELISVSGMGVYLSAIPNKRCNEICPPKEWRDENCDAKYSDFNKAQPLQFEK